MFPYLDLPGFKSRTVIPSTDVDAVETYQPGFVATRIAVWSSWINARLRKRYGTAGALPLGQAAPVLLEAGPMAPAVVLTGRPVLGSLAMRIRITSNGANPSFDWSKDGGVTWTAGGAVVGVVPVPLAGTGLAAVFGLGTYSTDNSYAAAPPVPETVLGWVVACVSVDVMRKRGVNPQDAMITLLVEEAARVAVEVKEAADSKDGLFDLPVEEDEGSAVGTGGPLFYSESSPYVSADRQERDGRCEDERGFGTTGGF